MSKDCRNAGILLAKSAGGDIGGRSFKISEKSTSRVDIGISNLKRWKALKCSFSLESDEDFASLLLDLAQERTRR